MAPARTPPLTSTSYAILGLLSLRPWTTYELAKQMDRAMGQFWPRAESKLYEEPKKLVAHGLAKATRESVGQRPRTVYSITPKGRKAMAAWMPEPATGPVLEFEALLKVFFAEHGTKADVLAAIHTARDWVDERYRQAEGISEGYLAGEGPFPDRLPWLILCGQLLQEFVDAVDR
jgi:PadR family transcriptional regulator AphA